VTSTERRIHFTDGIGVQIDDDITVSHLERLLDAVPRDEAEHAAVSVWDSASWFVEFNADSASFGRAEPEEELWVLPAVSRSTMRGIAREFIAGDFDAVKRRPWEPW
jgi:hypothetical protein